jgi:cation transport ATPase
LRMNPRTLRPYVRQGEIDGSYVSGTKKNGHQGRAVSLSARANRKAAKCPSSSASNRSLNMFTPVGLGVGVAYCYSVVAALVPKIFPPSFRDAGGQVPVYFDAASVITTLVLLGQVLELKARDQAGAAIRALLGLAPKTACLIREDGSEEDMSLNQVRRKDRLRVRPGDRNPVAALHPAAR